MSVFLIRHAQSEANAQQKTSSHATIALTEKGHEQAEQLHHRLPFLHHIIVSKFLRTQQTALPLIEAYNLELEIHDDLHEFSYLSEKKCENTDLNERKQWVSEYWEKLDPKYQDAVDAESFEQFYTRVYHFSEQLKHLNLQYKRKNLAIVTHGQFLTLLLMLLENFQPCSKQLMQDFRLKLQEDPIENTEIISLENYKLPEMTQSFFMISRVS